MSEQDCSQTTQSTETLILALGNPLRGDDGIGVAVLDSLKQYDLPAHITLLDGGTPGLEIALLLKDCERAIIIDAAEMDREPGQWMCISSDYAEFNTDDLHGTIHGAGLAEALALGEALKILPDEILIYGVQPEAIGWEPGLSIPVKKAIPSVCAAILDIVNEVKTHDQR